ncbi:hypothetical protein AAHE18_20G083500 [Arachis hypogaea]
MCLGIFPNAPQSSLKSLLVDHNHLSGKHTRGIDRSVKPNNADLSANNFSGEIPSNLSMIPGLVYFNDSGNNLDSEIPDALGSKFNNASSFAGNEKLCGKTLDRKCEEMTKKKHSNN